MNKNVLVPYEMKGLEKIYILGLPLDSVPLLLSVLVIVALLCLSRASDRVLAERRSRLAEPHILNAVPPGPPLPVDVERLRSGLEPFLGATGNDADRRFADLG